MKSTKLTVPKGDVNTMLVSKFKSVCAGIYVGMGAVCLTLCLLSFSCCVSKKHLYVSYPQASVICLFSYNCFYFTSRQKNLISTLHIMSQNQSSLHLSKICFHLWKNKKCNSSFSVLLFIKQFLIGYLCHFGNLKLLLQISLLNLSFVL